MTISNRNYEYNEQDKMLITGWHKVSITEITEPGLTKSGNATGFYIRLDVRVGSEIKERDVWMSFDHPNDFVITKSQNIGAMLQMMFPDIIDDSEYVGKSFHLLFRTYEDKKTGETKESYFDYKRNVSLDGKMTLEGKAIDESEKPAVKTTPKQTAKPNPVPAYEDTSSGGSDDVPF